MSDAAGHSVELLLNRLILASIGISRNDEREPEDRITDADLERIEAQIIALCRHERQMRAEAERERDEKAAILGNPEKWLKWCDAMVLEKLEAAEARVQALEQALRMSEQFINNGVELGYIRLPDSPDPALETLPAIRAALRPAVTEQP